MDATSPRWQQVTPSQHAWEEDALAVLRALLPDQDPYRAWANFEFTDGGRIHEADLLVITPKGVFLVEIKSWTGAVDGDQGTWVQRRRDGSLLSVDNPARLNTAKVRSLASLIRSHWPGGPTAPRPPFITSLVWFSNPTLRVSLPAELWPQVAVTRDAPTDGDAPQQHAPERIQTIEQAILRIGDAEAKDPYFRRVTAEQSDTFAQVMDRIGFKESTRTRTAGSYELQLPAFAERGATQDFMARHKVHGLAARVRVYSNVVGASSEEARALRDAASREYLATRNLSIDGVIRAIDMDLTDFGPAVIFEQPPGAVRLDRFMAEQGDSLDLDARLDIVEQLVATVRAMHKRRVTHRMLTPESVWLRPLHADGSRAQRFEPLISDFSLAAREHQAESRVATCTRIGSLPAAQTGAVEIVLGDPAMETYLAPETSTDSNPDGVALDVFSVGALTYLLCTGRAPTSDRSQMRAALGSTGLSLSAVLPEVDPQLESLVRHCTTPIVSERARDMATVADELALVRAGLDGDEPSGPVDPLTAAEGDVLEDRFEVRRRLGKGSTAVGLWCHDRNHDRDVVLKVASSGDSDLRLDATADSGDADALIDHLVATGMLFEDQGMLSIGPEGERSYGFRHFMELTSVFTSPPLFVIRHGRDELGYLDPTSLLTNDRSYATVLLAGRNWKITSIDWKRRFAWVEPADGGGRSRWFGGGRPLSSTLCDAIRDVASGIDPAGVTLSERARNALADVRQELRFAQPGHQSVVLEQTRARWWSWAGQRANTTLRDAVGDLAVTQADDLSMGLDPATASVAEVSKRLADLHPDTLPTPSVAEDFAANMKFADCLPPTLALEVARQRLVDPDGVRRVLTELAEINWGVDPSGDPGTA